MQHAALARLALVAALAAPPARALLPAQDARPSEPPDVFAVYSAADERGDLAVIVALETLLDDVRGTPDEDLVFDLLATRLTFAHDERESVRLDGAAYAEAKRHGGEPVLDGFAPRDAVAAVVELARGRRVLMLNEEHRRSQQRAFANELLAPLVDAGFTHLALETLSPTLDADALARRGYPLASDGFYTRDPLLGDLVRRALELGLGVRAYEADGAQRPRELDPLEATNWREEQQARNLARILEDEPEARVIVWCGRHHLSELQPEAESESGPGAWTPMGGILKRLAGIDPLTVDLMLMVEGDVPERERAVYRDAVARGAIERPTLFLDESGAPYSALEGIDAMVFLPRSRFDRGRPQWMRAGLRSERTLDAAALGRAPSPGRPLAIEARVSGESADAVPVDCVLWRGGEPPALWLRPELEYEVLLRPPDGAPWPARLAPLPEERAR